NDTGDRARRVPTGLASSDLPMVRRSLDSLNVRAYIGHTRRGPMKKFNRRLTAALVAVVVSVTTTIALKQESGPEFERQNRVAEFVRLLGAQPGSLVADVGAGDGAFTIPIARAVAPNGRAVAVDISDPALNKLRDRAGREDVKNVEIVVGGADDPHLPV